MEYITVFTQSRCTLQVKHLSSVLGDNQELQTFKGNMTILGSQNSLGLRFKSKLVQILDQGVQV